MKRKLIFIQTLFLTITICLSSNLQAQRQSISGTSIGIKESAALTSNQSELQASMKTTSLTELTTTKPVYYQFSCGLGSSTQAACESAYTFFSSSSSFGGATLYWDPSLSTRVTWGTLVVTHADNKIWNFNSGTSTVGAFTGNYCQ